eukprot:4777408-Prymnesium_polylepis.1
MAARGQAARCCRSPPSRSATMIPGWRRAGTAPTARRPSRAGRRTPARRTTSRPRPRGWCPAAAHSASASRSCGGRGRSRPTSSSPAPSSRARRRLRVRAWSRSRAHPAVRTGPCTCRRRAPRATRCSPWPWLVGLAATTCLATCV